MTRIWTIGHSTRTIEEFIGALQANGIKLVADVRLLPGSKRYPQFNKEELARSLREDGIGYEHFPELGGRRKARKDSRNTAWRNESFRGYADHMETAEFANGIAITTNGKPRWRDSNHVRRSSVVEVSSQFNCRLLKGTWCCSHSHH